MIKGLGDGLPDALDGGAISELDAYIAAGPRNAGRSWNSNRSPPILARSRWRMIARCCAVLTTRADPRDRFADIFRSVVCDAP